MITMESSVNSDGDSGTGSLNEWLTFYAIPPQNRFIFMNVLIIVSPPVLIDDHEDPFDAIFTFSLHGNG